MLKNFYLISKNSNDAARFIPFLWCSAKTYYEENGKKTTEWSWADPWFGSDRSVDEILEACELAPPSILGCSVYVWNISFMDELAKKVKQRWPQCLIVYGGPQVDIKYTDDFFKLNHWVDMVCPSDAYGEIVIAAMLDHYPIDDFERIPYIYYTDHDRSKIMSKTGIEKRSFRWPSNIYKAQERYLQDKTFGIVMYETSRGCPYKCIYCDWGGGTFSKVTKKPFHTIIDELEWIAKNQIPGLVLTDANFGIMGIDVEIARYICEFKRKYGYPEWIDVQWSKNSPDRNAQIIDMFLEHKIMYYYKIAVQAIDDEIKNNIERVDVPFEQQVDWFNHFKKKYPYVGAKVEIIMGLPGDNYQKVLKQIDLQLEHNMSIAQSELWALLPEAPAFSPDMRDKFQIKTIRKPFLNYIIQWKEGITPDPGVRSNARWGDTDKVEYVIGTYSYDVRELIDMFVINSLGSAVAPVGLNHMINYCRREHGATGSVVLDDIYRHLIQHPERFRCQDLAQGFANLMQSLTRYFLDDQEKTAMIDYHPDLPFRLPAHVFIPFLISANAQDFFGTVANHLAQRYHDTRLVDLANYLTNVLMDVNYDFDHGRDFTCSFNWLGYNEGSELGPEGQYHFRVSDQNVLYSTDGISQADWHRYPKGSILQKKQWFYQALLSNLYQSLLCKQIYLAEPACR